MKFSDFLTEEQQAWRETCHRFVDRQITREYIRRCDMDREYYYEGYEKVAREGWLGLMVPEQYGGIGGTGMADAKGSSGSHIVSRPIFWLLLCLCAAHCAAISDYPYSGRAVQRLPMAGKNSTLRQNHDTNGSNEFAG